MLRVVFWQAQARSATECASLFNFRTEGRGGTYTVVCPARAFFLLSRFLASVVPTVRSLFVCLLRVRGRAGSAWGGDGDVRRWRRANVEGRGGTGTRGGLVAVTCVTAIGL